MVHNTPTFNHKLQQVDGFADIIRYPPDTDFHHAEIILSSIYKHDLVKAQRGISIVDRKYMVVRDELETLDRTTTIHLTMLTPASVSIEDGATVLLSQQGKSLQLQIECTHPVKLKSWSTESPNA